MKKRWIILAAALFLLLSFALSQKLQVSRYTRTSDKLSQPVSLAVVSDLHNAAFGKNQAELAAAIHAAQPDAVLMLGDMAEDMRSLSETCNLVEALGGKYPVYYVSGNHECASGELDAIKTKLRGLGVRVLEGESEVLSCGVRIAGADDPLCLYREEWQAQIEACRAQDDTFTVLMSHRPDRIDFYREGFDLILCGHAHGGQVRIPGILENGLWSPNQGLFPQYTTGVHEAGQGHMIVSRGLSKGLLPRVFNRPELVIVQLNPA